MKQTLCKQPEDKRKKTFSKYLLSNVYQTNLTQPSSKFCVTKALISISFNIFEDKLENIQHTVDGLMLENFLENSYWMFIARWEGCNEGNSTGTTSGPCSSLSPWLAWVRDGTDREGWWEQRIPTPATQGPLNKWCNSNRAHFLKRKNQVWPAGRSCRLHEYRVESKWPDSSSVNGTEVTVAHKASAKQ